MRTKTGGTHPSPTTALSTHQEPQAKLPTHKNKSRPDTPLKKQKHNSHYKYMKPYKQQDLTSSKESRTGNTTVNQRKPEFTTTVKRIAGNRLAPPETNTGNIICKNERQESDCETWQKSQDNLKRYRTSTEQLQEPENTPRFNKLLARLPGHIHSTKAPLKRKDKQWVAMIRWERRAHSSNYAHTEQSKSATTE
jgi:hypothetical protein